MLCAEIDKKVTAFLGRPLISSARLVGAILREPNDERSVQRSRHMTLESIAPIGDDRIVNLPPSGKLTVPVRPAS